MANGIAEAGAKVVMVYRSSRSAAEAAAAQVSQKHGVKVVAYQADVSDLAAIDATVSRVVDEFGCLDIVVANAGVCFEVDTLNFEPAQLMDLMSTNLNGAFYTAQAAARVFKAQGAGNIIFTTSISSVIVNLPERQAAVRTNPLVPLCLMCVCLAFVRKCWTCGRPPSTTLLPSIAHPLCPPLSNHCDIC